nr:MAG TPA: hypothetical protein [Caudoviricetes sp.]
MASPSFSNSLNIASTQALRMSFICPPFLPMDPATGYRYASRCRSSRTHLFLVFGRALVQVFLEIGDHLLLRIHDDSSHLHELRADARATPVRQGAFLDAAVVRDVLRCIHRLQRRRQCGKHLFVIHHAPASNDGWRQYRRMKYVWPLATNHGSPASSVRVCNEAPLKL